MLLIRFLIYKILYIKRNLHYNLYYKYLNYFLFNLDWMSVLLNTEGVIRFLSKRKEQSHYCIQSTRITRQAMPEDPKLLEERKLIEWKKYNKIPAQKLIHYQESMLLKYVTINYNMLNIITNL